MSKPKKATRIEKGILLAAVWLARDMDRPSMAVDLLKHHGVNNLDVSDHAEFDREVFADLNKYNEVRFVLEVRKPIACLECPGK
jgi:hypothetical protein